MDGASANDGQHSIRRQRDFLTDPRYRRHWLLDTGCCAENRWLAAAGVQCFIQQAAGWPQPLTTGHMLLSHINGNTLSSSRRREEVNKNSNVNKWHITHFLPAISVIQIIDPSDQWQILAATSTSLYSSFILELYEVSAVYRHC